MDKDFIWKKLVKNEIHEQKIILKMILRELEYIHDTLKKSI